MSKPAFTQEYVRALSEKVYRAELARAAGGSEAKWKEGEADRMIAKLNEKGLDGPTIFSNRAGQYDHLTRAYLGALEIKP